MILAARQNSHCSCQHWYTRVVFSQLALTLVAAEEHVQGRYLAGLKDYSYQVFLWLFPKDYFCYAFWEQVTLYWSFTEKARSGSGRWPFPLNYGLAGLYSLVNQPPRASPWDKKLQWGALLGPCCAPAGLEAAHSHPVPLRGCIYTKVTSENCLLPSHRGLPVRSSSNISFCSRHEGAALETNESGSCGSWWSQLRTLHLLLQAEAKSITCIEIFMTLVTTTILTLNSCSSFCAWS